MKSKSIATAVLSATLALFVATSQPSWAGDRAPMTNGPVMTAKEAKALVVIAKTASDHRKLAQYFNQQAGQSEAAARDHDEMIAAYRSARNPAVQNIKAPGGVGTIEHCEFLAKSNREMAQAAASVPDRPERP